MTDTDIFYKKTVTLPVGKRSLQLDVAQALFSSHEVDSGTKMLLKSLAKSQYAAQWRQILDVGCGYGALGLALKAADKRRKVDMVDRDALAVAFTQRNAEKNGLAVTAVGSLGYDAVPNPPYDLIVSNIPGKAGEAVITDLLTQARHFLHPDGMVAVVIVAPLADLVRRVLSALPDVVLLYEESNRFYAVFHYRFTGPPSGVYETAVSRHLYARHNGTFQFKKATFHMETVKGLPEFDTLSYQTRLLMNQMERQDDSRMRRVMLVNPGQGHLAVAAWLGWQPEAVLMVDKDLLALQTAAANLQHNGCPSERIYLFHQPTWRLPDVEPPVDGLLGVLRDSDGPVINGRLLETAVAHLTPHAACHIAANSHLISQLATRLTPPWREQGKRKKRKGFSAVTLSSG
ncbi:MAG: hypothetical protein Kow0080_26230 [Candidatus Promineifilaceae bacterium]